MFNFAHLIDMHFCPCTYLYLKRKKNNYYFATFLCHLKSEVVQYDTNYLLFYYCFAFYVTKKNHKAIISFLLFFKQGYI